MRVADSSLGSLLAVASIDLAGMAMPTIILLGVEMALGVPFLLFVEGWGSTEHVLLSFAGAQFRWFHLF